LANLFFGWVKNNFSFVEESTSVQKVIFSPIFFFSTAKQSLQEGIRKKFFPFNTFDTLLKINHEQ